MQKDDRPSLSLDLHVKTKSAHLDRLGHDDILTSP